MRYWHFLDKGVTFQPDVCNGCRDVLIMSITLSNIAVLTIYGADYWCCIISGISKREVVNYCKKKADLKKKSGAILKIYHKYIYIYIYIYILYIYIYIL